MRTLACLRMRILYTRNLYRPKDFGGNRYPLEVTTRLAQRGHDVVVLTGHFAGQLSIPGIRIVQYPVSRRNPLLTFSTNCAMSRVAAARVLRGWQPDVIVQSSYDVAYGCRLVPVARTPAVFIYHSSFHSEAVRRLQDGSPLHRIMHPLATALVRHVERAVLSGADRIVAVSPFSEAEVRLRAPRMTGRTAVISTGVDALAFSPGDRATARSNLAIDQADLVLITVGRLAPVKRYDHAILAVANLRQVGFPATLLMVGDGPERSKLECLATDLGLQQHVRFEGFRSGIAIVERLRAADLQLCTSEFENWSLALLEGLACGVPVVGTPYGGTARLLAPVDPSLVLPDGEVDTLVRRVIDLTADHDQLRRIGRRAREYATKFDWENVVRDIEQFLLKVVKDGERRVL